MARLGGSQATSSAACFLSVLPAPSCCAQCCSLSGVGSGSVDEESKAVPALFSDCDRRQPRSLLSVLAHAAMNISFPFYET